MIQKIFVFGALVLALVTASSDAYATPPTLVLKNNFGEQTTNYVLGGTYSGNSPIAAHSVSANNTGSSAIPTGLSYAALSALLSPTQVCTGYVSGAGTVSASDTVLSAIEKLNGNAALLAPGGSSGAVQYNDGSGHFAGSNISISGSNHGTVLVQGNADPFPFTVKEVGGGGSSNAFMVENDSPGVQTVEVIDAPQSVGASTGLISFRDHDTSTVVQDISAGYTGAHYVLQFLDDRNGNTPFMIDYTSGVSSFTGGQTQLNNGASMNGNTVANVLDPVNPQDAATKNYVDKTALVVCGAGSGGSATEALTCTGLVSTDTVLAVTQNTSGSNNLALIGWSTLATNSITGIWALAPGAGAVVQVLVRHL